MAVTNKQVKVILNSPSYTGGLYALTKGNMKFTDRRIAKVVQRVKDLLAIGEKEILKYVDGVENKKKKTCGGNCCSPNHGNHNTDSF